MRKNDIIESEYIGWGTLEKKPLYDRTSAEFTVWENNSGSFRIKKVTLGIQAMKKYRFCCYSPIIRAVDTQGNQTLSEVSRISNNSAAKEILYSNRPYRG